MTQGAITSRKHTNNTGSPTKARTALEDTGNPTNKKEKNSKSTSTCLNCGGEYPHNGGMSKCPTQGKECYNCVKLNHLSKYCLSQPKQRNKIETRPANQMRARRSGLHKLSDSEDTDEDVFTLSLNSVSNDHTKHPTCQAKINGTWTELLIDSGASINLLDEKDFNSLQPRPSLEQTNVKIFPYQSTVALPILGKFKAHIEATNAMTTEATFFVTQGKAGSILSWRTSECLGLIKIARQLTNTAYRRGIDNPADYMSRHPTKYTKTSSRQEKVAEEFVDYITVTSTPKAINIQEITDATRLDPTLQAVMNAVNTGNWFKHSKHPDIDVEAYKAMDKVKNELTINMTHGVILKGLRIIMPASLQQRVVDLAHEGHQGMVKTKKLLREKVWFHRMNNMVEAKVASCGACQVSTPSTTREPLKMSPLPASAWKEVSIDFKHLSAHEYLLVITDDYSRYPVVELVKSTSAPTVIPVIDKTFATFGIPEIVRSDNGPPFSGKEFKEFAQTLGFIHRKVTPLWPRANGEVELKKAILAARTEGKPWKTELCKLLRNYRSTPHSTTGIAPSTVLFNRPMRNKLPSISQPTSGTSNIAQADQRAKEKMKVYADSKIYVKPSNISVGDTVLVKGDPSAKKSQSPYKPEPFTVTERKGSMVTAKSGDKVTTRNSSFFKQIPATSLKAPDSNVDIDDHCVTTRTDDKIQNYITPNPEDTSSSTRRYPERDRRPPKYLSDYVR
ncbi:Uncharacterized protein K02A2.6 [Exaiptasia diaphana]|nr:Uncharacterized protein K02A2.6 [Exaiptasia diaphana]